MAQVTVRINGYAYTVGCQDGEEEHLQAMAGEVDRRIESVKAVAGPSGEARMLVMASLLMADDLFETDKALRAAQAGQATGQPSAAPADPKLGRRLGKLAKRAEEIALDLEHP
ncbi:MAG TPA: cell division protein ZapA [Acetobacteraceae bacterium]|jgi:cell division protein ZapA|nr:cell division protein ZapA [Acetobacteraceae bacterium]